MDTLISNATVVTVNEQMDVLFGAYLGITDGKISYIGQEPPKEQPKTIIDGTGMVAIPGFVNAHTHLATTALRSFLDDVSHPEALEKQLQKEVVRLFLSLDMGLEEPVLRSIASKVSPEELQHLKNALELRVAEYLPMQTQLHGYGKTKEDLDAGYLI